MAKKKVNKAKTKKTVKPKAKKAVKKIVKKSTASKKAKAKPAKSKPAKKVVAKKTKVTKSPKPSKVKPVKSPKVVATKPVKPVKVKEQPKAKPEKVKEVAAPVAAPAAAPVPGRRGRTPKPVVPKIIKTNVIMPKLVEEMAIQKTKKEPAGKFQLEFVVHASPSLLFEFFSTPPGLSEWFSDDVNIRDGIYTFYWDGQQQNAKVIGMKQDQFIRFQWVDRNDGSYFEFRVVTDELTNDVSLIITDFAETTADAETSKLLWNSQVGKLMQVLGAY